MTLEQFLTHIKQNKTVQFDETMAVIAENYDYQPADFTNGIGEKQLHNEAGTNEGSCKIFAFGLLNQLTVDQTLHLFGDYYRKDVLQDPEGTGHQNIRNFMKFGWDGISFSKPVLTPKKS